MNIALQAAILGVVQGLTEFLPISSSGHLIIFQKLFTSVTFSPVALSLVLHLGTLLALVVYFIKDWRILLSSKALIWSLILATIITAALILPFKDKIEQSFNNLQMVSIMLIVTSIILYIASHYQRVSSVKDVGWKNSLIIGIAQALAVMPGLSRSGVTIAAGIFSGLSMNTAIQFSFLLAIPTILGSTILEMHEVIQVASFSFWPLLAGFLAAFFTGLIAIRWLVKLLSINQKNLVYFAVYCFIIGLLTLFL